MIKLLSNVFPFIEAKANASVNAEGGISSSQSTTIEVFPIETPQRQLVHLTLHYLINHPDYLLQVPDPSEKEWFDRKKILDVPRQLVFLDLPGHEEVEEKKVKTKFIPTAAEFADGKVVPLYVNLCRNNGERPPIYPEPLEQTDLSQLHEKRREYWKLFDENFSAQKATEVVEEATFKHGRIRWIDYRVPIASDGSTLHLHFCPAEKFDTGVFAYNLIKRGFKHGVRLVGTLKSGPDLNVMATYEK